MKTFNRTLTLILFVGLFLIGCTKEGKQGEPGTNGQNGNANVKSISLVASSWLWDSSSSTRYYVWSGIPELTYDIASYGAVHLYQLNSAGNGYLQLPITAPISSGIVESDFYQYGTGTLSVYIQNSNLSDPLLQIPTPTKYKLVTISASAKVANPDLDYSNYDAVAKLFKLE